MLDAHDEGAISDAELIALDPAEETVRAALEQASTLLAQRPQPDASVRERIDFYLDLAERTLSGITEVRGLDAPE